MRMGFTKGFIIGSIVGASIAMMNPDMVNKKTRKRMIRNGRNFLRKSGDIIGDVMDMFR